METLKKANAQLMSWRQAAGAFGQLLLHPCWEEASSLDRRYHGQTIYRNAEVLQGALRLYKANGDISWRLLADDVAANILYLQTPGGGFYHAAYEFEPSYTCEHSCPIHQSAPILALLDYVEFPEANANRVALIKPAIDTWWKWMERFWWLRGNQWKQPLEVPGFCGVTNQDLVVVAALARYARVYQDDSLYVRFGKPVLDTYLGPAYYHSQIGLFERGDKPNFVERTSYYEVIISMLEIIHRETGDPRLPEIVDNVARHLFDALHIGPDGLTHLSWGAETEPGNRAEIKGWRASPYSFKAYPALIEIMHAYLQRHPNPQLQAGYDNLEKTLAAYVYADATIPVSLGTEPVFALAGYVNTLWTYLVNRLGPQAQLSATPGPVPSVHRSCGDFVWKSNAHAWQLSRDNNTLYAGIKCNPGAIAIGPEEPVSGYDFTQLLQVDSHEVVQS